MFLIPHKAGLKAKKISRVKQSHYILMRGLLAGEMAQLLKAFLFFQKFRPRSTLGSPHSPVTPAPGNLTSSLTSGAPVQTYTLTQMYRHICTKRKTHTHTQKKKSWDEEMAQTLSTLTALPDDSSSIPSTHTVGNNCL